MNVEYKTMTNKNYALQNLINYLEVIFYLSSLLILSISFTKEIRGTSFYIECRKNIVN